MNNMYEILSDNLTRLRKSRNLTQAEFADIIKYSDKSVSKWETGAAIPNLETLVAIADFYGMTIDSLIRVPIDSNKVEQVQKVRKTNKLVIALLSIASILLLASIIFVIGIIKHRANVYWLAFIWSIPLSFMVSIIFSFKWERKLLYLFISCFVWTIITAIYLELLIESNTKANYWMLFFIGIPIQIIVLLVKKLKSETDDDIAEKHSLNLKRKLERQKLKKKLKALENESENK